MPAALVLAACAWLLALPASAQQSEDPDPRYRGSYATAREALGARAQALFARTLHVSFPHRSSVVVTATPVCFRDIAVTVAHVAMNVGQGTAHPKGLLLQVPDLNRSGRFRGLRRVRDYLYHDLSKRFDNRSAPPPWHDLLVLQLDQPVPADIDPLTLAPPDESTMVTPRCATATVNVAYHRDLGLRAGRVTSITDVRPGSPVAYSGAVPLFTTSSGYHARPMGNGQWWSDPRLAYPRHRIFEFASGSAVVCPGPQRDVLHGVIVGQVLLPASEIASGSESGSPRSVANTNLSPLFAGIARLKGMSPEALVEQCTTKEGQR